MVRAHFTYISSHFRSLLHSTSCRIIGVSTFKRGVTFWTPRLYKLLPFLTSSSMLLRSITDPMPRQQHVLMPSFNHLHNHILHHINVLPINTLHLRLVFQRALLHHICTLIFRPVIWRAFLYHIHTLHLHHVDTCHIHTLLPQSVVRRVVILLHHIHSLHFWHIHILHLKLFIMEVVTTQVEGKILPIQIKLRQGWRKEMSGPTTMRKIWYFTILSFHCCSFEYYVVVTN
jgi:hypothetical protein